MSNEREVVDKLTRKGWTIAFAESCTGGLAAATLISVPDASKVINASVVTYSCEAKEKYTGTTLESIEKYGVVSEEVGRSMAEGIAKNNDAQVGVGITGFAGPSGDPDCIPPVGTVCFGFCINGETCTFTKHYGDIGRNPVREKSVEFVFEKLNELL